MAPTIRLYPQALEEVMEVIERDDIRSFLDGESEEMH
jgi:hypothetical protein